MLKKMAVVALCTLYVVATIQHPQFNFDDLALVPYFQSLIAKYGLWDALVSVFLADDLPTEYRTYSLARSLQLLMTPLFGVNAFPYFFIMAACRLAIAFFVGDLVRMAQRSPVWTVEAFGAAIIATISPFAMCRTFHHFAYLILPILPILGMVWLAQRSKRPLLMALQAAVFVPFFGEAAIPALFASLAMIAWQMRRPTILLLIPLSIGLLAAHYWLLSLVGNYGGANRYGGGDATLIQRNMDFLSSIVSTILRGLWLPHLDREPYQYGLSVAVDMWSHLDWWFVAGLASVGGLVFPLVRDAPSVRIPGRFIIASGIFCCATLSIYIALAQVATLYGHPYGLQARYGYVPLTAFAVAVFLAFRQTPARAVVLALPAGLLVVFVAVATVQIPRQATIDGQLLAQIKKTTEIPGAALMIGHRKQVDWRRAPGPQNPLILSIDTPYQQNWTTHAVSWVVSPALLFWPVGFEVDNDQVQLTDRGEVVAVVPAAKSYVVGTTDDAMSNPRVMAIADWLTD